MGISDFFRKKKVADKEEPQEKKLAVVENIEDSVVEVEAELEDETKYFITYDEAVAFCDGFDRNHVWAFCSGQASDDFRGNPKYLFTYISKYHKDIKAFWFCKSTEIIKVIREQGFNSFSPCGRG